MITLRVKGRVFDVPRLFFTLRGQTRSEAVIQALLKLRPGQDCRVFENAAEVTAYFQGGVSPNSAVVLFDSGGGRKCYAMHAANRPGQKIPSWASGAFWGVAIYERTRESSAQGSGSSSNRRIAQCAEFLSAIFNRRFTDQVSRNEMPWGPCRKNEPAPQQVDMPTDTDGLLRRLNDGPNLAASIASAEHALELPTGSRISWVRVTTEPGKCDEDALLRTLHVLQSLERTTADLFAARSEVRDLLLAGVNLLDRKLIDLYLNPPKKTFTVDRPDLHLTENGLHPSEMDEMPGGMPEACHLDRAYGVNQARWQWFFEWLTAQGPVLFLVSHEWSKVYIPEMSWLVDYICSLGHHVYFATTEELDALQVESDGVFWRGEKMGTVWRQFPVFEICGKLVQLVAAAQAGLVRLVPEFGYMGNKTTFALFWKYLGFFQERLSSGEFDLLREILPDSSLVRPRANSFPLQLSIRGQHLTVASLRDLRELPLEWRDELVLKVAGANTNSARSYGVLMGNGLTDATWREWLDDRVRYDQPFLVQTRFRTAVTRVGVLHTKRGVPESFDCRLLARPWFVDGRVVSIHGCAVPRNTERVHGMVDMAVVPFDLGPFKPE